PVCPAPVPDEDPPHRDQRPAALVPPAAPRDHLHPPPPPAVPGDTQHRGPRGVMDDLGRLGQLLPLLAGPVGRPLSPHPRPPPAGPPPAAAAGTGWPGGRTC